MLAAGGELRAFFGCDNDGKVNSGLMINGYILCLTG